MINVDDSPFPSIDHLRIQKCELGHRLRPQIFLTSLPGFRTRSRTASSPSPMIVILKLLEPGCGWPAANILIHLGYLSCRIARLQPECRFRYVVSGPYAYISIASKSFVRTAFTGTVRRSPGTKGKSQREQMETPLRHLASAVNGLNKFSSSSWCFRIERCGLRSTRCRAHSGCQNNQL